MEGPKLHRVFSRDLDEKVIFGIHRTNKYPFEK
jgi:hypothetical protein